MRRDSSGALREADIALIDRPTCDGAFAAKAHILTYMGRSDEVSGLARRAIELTPLYPPHYPAVLAHAYATSGRYEDAIAASDAVLAQYPDTLDVQLIRIGSCAALGRTAEAKNSARAMLRDHPNFRVDAFAQTQRYIDPAHLERVTGALKRAGLS